MGLDPVLEAKVFSSRGPVTGFLCRLSFDPGGCRHQGSALMALQNLMLLWVVQYFS